MGSTKLAHWNQNLEVEHHRDVEVLRERERREEARLDEKKIPCITCDGVEPHKQTLVDARSADACVFELLVSLS